MAETAVELCRTPTHWLGRFAAMASPCEVLIDSDDDKLAEQALAIVAGEAWRIEAKFSRYRDDNIIHRINDARGEPVEVDEETALLLDFADACHRLSDGRFDVTSGVLRRVWRFDGSDRTPSASAVREVLQHVGWERVSWRKPVLSMRPGMEIDFGGLGKEYAVDRCFDRLRGVTGEPFLLNFGGDLRVSGVRRDGSAWRIGVENPDMQAPANRRIELRLGAVATSGDSRRFLYRDGIRYSHILDPRSGWPVAGAPRSVTVAAPTTVEAGMLATFASLHGAEAERFLQNQGVPHWVLW